MMMPSALRKQFLLHARKLQFQKCVETTLKNIEAYLNHAPDSYICVSGGKDSSVLLDISRRVQPQLDAIFLDMNAAYSETDKILATYENLTRIPISDRLSDLKEVGMHGKMSTVKGFNNTSLQGYSGFFYGLRAEESAGRRKQVGRNYYQKKDGMWVCQPLIRWNYNDIWAYIVSEGIEYNELYDLMWDRPKHSQRVASFALTKQNENGSTAYLKMTHLELFNKLIQRTKEFRQFV